MDNGINWMAHGKRHLLDNGTKRIIAQNGSWHKLDHGTKLIMVYSQNITLL